jgi:thiamine-phosphate pyrophosphorylase
VPLIVYKRTDVALAVTADGVHVEAEDMPVAICRRLLGPHAIVGVTVRSVADAIEAERQGATYVAVGPIFISPQAPGVLPLGTRAITEIAASVRLPVCAMGGITLENIEQLRSTPAALIAVHSAIATAPDARGLAHKLLQRLSAPA